MHKYLSYVCGALLFAALPGCASSKMIAAKTQSERTDVFTEATGQGAGPRGFTGMIVRANIKTHEEGHYPGESAKSPHGKPDYSFLLNIDGQAVVWKVGGQKDVRPAKDENGRTSKDPEARTGIKYLLERKIWLRPGTHKVYFGLPEDDYIVEAEIAVPDEEGPVLEFKPVYRYRRHPVLIPSFLQGVRDYEIYLSGVRIR